MITLFSGTPGSGKSLHLANVLYNKYKYSKAPIIANFECDFSHIKRPRGEFICKDNLELTPQYLIDFSFEYSKRIGRKAKEEEILLVIDECQLLFNSRDWGKNDRSAWLSFFTQHRKLGYRIILVAQFDRMLDRQIRSLIEYEFIHRKVSNYGIQGKILTVFAMGNLFVAVKVWYPMKEKVGSEFFKAHKKYYRIYDTFTLFAEPIG